MCRGQARARGFPLKDVHPGVHGRRGGAPTLSPPALQTGAAVPGLRGLATTAPPLARRPQANPGASRNLLFPPPTAPKGNWGGVALASPKCLPSTPGGRCPDRPQAGQENPCSLFPGVHPSLVPISQIWKPRHSEWLGARPSAPGAQILQATLFSV